MTSSTADMSNTPFHLTSASLSSVARSDSGERERSTALQ